MLLSPGQLYQTVGSLLSLHAKPRGAPCWVENWGNFHSWDPKLIPVSLPGAPRDGFPAEDSHSTISEQELNTPQLLCLCIYTRGKVAAFMWVGVKSNFLWLVASKF